MSELERWVLDVRYYIMKLAVLSDNIAKISSEVAMRCDNNYFNL